jgi:TPR repeat protein
MSSASSSSSSSRSLRSKRIANVITHTATTHDAKKVAGAATEAQSGAPDGQSAKSKFRMLLDRYAASCCTGNKKDLKEVQKELVDFAQTNHAIYPRAAAICGVSLYSSWDDDQWPAFPIDRPLGEKLLTQARDAGDVVGKFWCAFFGVDETENHKKAFSIVNDLHRANPIHNDGYVLFLIGLCYYHRCGVAQHCEKAFWFFIDSAACGNPFAMYYLGRYYVDREHVPQEHDKAFKWWHKAANHGHGHAMHNISACYRIGEGVTRDEQQADEWQEKYKSLYVSDK